MKTLLLIDADASFLKKLQALLEPTAVKLVVEKSGSAAVKTANDLAPDAIILNLELGDVNGFLVCSSLKKSPATRDIPILITSSQKTEEDFEQHRKLKFRADGYYRKPVAREDLVAMLVEHLGPETVRSSGANPLTDDFTEENIDKLLDTTFLDFSETGEGEEIEPEPAAVSEPETTDAPATGSVPDTGDDFLLSDEDIALDDVPAEATARLAPEADAEEDGEDFSDILEDVAPELEEVVTDEPQPDAGSEPVSRDPAPETASPKVQTADDFAEIVEPLKQQVREQSVQIISLEKENAFLKNENKELLMNLTSLKADTEEKVAEEQEKNAELVKQVANLEEQLSDMVNRHATAVEERDALGARVEELAPLTDRVAELERELASVREERDRFQQDLDSIRAERDRLQEERDAARDEQARLTGELEDRNRDYRERISRLSGLLKDAVSTVELPEE